MPTLEKTVKDGIRKIERQAETTIRSRIKNDALRMWNGRKIIPAEEWKKFALVKEKVLQYLPDDFLPHTIFWHLKGDENFEREKAKWKEDYFDYLTNKKNPSLGKAKCHNCILNPPEFKKTNSIRDILIKYFANPKVSFPCQVVNIFECPYEQGSKDCSLFSLGYIWKILHDALDHSYQKTRYDNKKLIEADFERDRAIQYGEWPSTEPYPDTVARQIGDLRLSQVPVKEIRDIFEVITNRKR